MSGIRRKLLLNAVQENPIKEVGDYILWFDGKDGKENKNGKWYPKSPHAIVSASALTICGDSTFNDDGGLIVIANNETDDKIGLAGASDYPNTKSDVTQFDGPMHKLQSLGYSFDKNQGFTIEIVSDVDEYQGERAECYYFGITYTLRAAERGGLRFVPGVNKLNYYYNNGSSWTAYDFNTNVPNGKSVITLKLDTSSVLSLYVNGFLCGAVTVPSSFNLNCDEQQPFSIGSYDASKKNAVKGLHYSFKLYPRPLSDDEISQNFQFYKKYYSL